MTLDYLGSIVNLEATTSTSSRRAEAGKGDPTQPYKMRLLQPYTGVRYMIDKFTKLSACLVRNFLASVTVALFIFI